MTGGARGIGLEICNSFLQRSYRVAALDKDKETLAKAEGHFNSPDFLASHCDVSKPVQVSRAVARMEKKFGRIDSLVNNAGVAIFKPILEVTWQDWRYIMDTNLDAGFDADGCWLAHHAQKSAKRSTVDAEAEVEVGLIRCANFSLTRACPMNVLVHWRSAVMGDALGASRVCPACARHLDVQAPMLQSLQVVSHRLEPFGIHLAHHNALAFGQIRHHLTPRVNQHAVSVGLATTGVGAALRSG